MHTRTSVCTLFVVLGLGAVLVGCSSSPSTTAPSAIAPAISDGGGSGLTVQTTLYFGMNSPDGRGVSEQGWKRFLDEFVTPRFPDGLTVLHATGQYRSPPPPKGDGSLTVEPSRVLVVVHDGGADARRRIHEVAAEYARRFGQESVLRVDAAAQVSFETAP